MNVTGSPFTLTNTTNNNNIDIKTTGSGSVVHAVKITQAVLFEAKTRVQYLMKIQMT